MKKILMSISLSVILTAMTSTVFAVDLKLSWQAPTTYTDSTPIGKDSTITYKVFGANQGQVLQLLTTTSALTAVRSNVDGNVHCYAVAAVVGGTQSAMSDAVCIKPNMNSGPTTPPSAVPTAPTVKVEQVASSTVTPVVKLSEASNCPIGKVRTRMGCVWQPVTGANQ